MSNSKVQGIFSTSKEKTSHTLTKEHFEISTSFYITEKSKFNFGMILHKHTKAKLIPPTNQVQEIPNKNSKCQSMFNPSILQPFAHIIQFLACQRQWRVNLCQNNNQEHYNHVKLIVKSAVNIISAKLHYLEICYQLMKVHPTPTR